jgi:radical SAM superfamily enzyme YgiQ (UPF0313 family)
MLPHIPQVRAELEKLRQADIKAETIAGGSQATAAPESISELGFDYTVSGECEDFFPQFLSEWLAGSAKKGIHQTARGQVDLDRYPGFSEIPATCRQSKSVAAANSAACSAEFRNSMPEPFAIAASPASKQ